jgi:type IV secretion system protein VirB6
MPAGPGSSLLAPFTVIDQAYRLGFDAYLSSAVGSIENAIATPLLACVTLWVIVQSILVMRGDLDARRGITKLIKVALVVGLVTSHDLYHDYVVDLFETAIPSMIRDMGGNLGLPMEAVPVQLDLIFRAGQAGFQKVAVSIPPMNELDALSFQGAQFFFNMSLFGIFSIYHITHILTLVLLSVGPLFLLGFLFEATEGIATRWIGQLVSYAILLLLVSMVAQVVVGIILTGMAVVFLVTLGKGTTAAQIIGLYELDFFIMTGNALIVALPAIAASLGSGVAAETGQMAKSVFRQFSGTPSSVYQYMG